MKDFLKNYKKDMIIIVGFLIAAVAAYYMIHLYYGENGETVSIYVDGDLVAAYDITVNDCYRIPVGDEYNEISIEDGKVRVSSSSCANQICVNHISISKSGESIICLPHKLVVRIDDKEGTQKEHGLDGVAE